jgi:hypothetical protein
VSKNDTRQRILYPVSDVGHSAKITIVSYRRLLAALYRASLFAECVALGKVVFVECLPVPRILLSVNMVVTESRTLPSAALGKDGFVECPTKNTQQSTEHSTKSQIPVVYQRDFELIFFENVKRLCIFLLRSGKSEDCNDTLQTRRTRTECF